MQQTSGDPIRYAVVGLGHIAQAAVLPAFDNAENAELVALISHDDEKLKTIGDNYNIDQECRVHYDEMEALFDKGVVDALYIALPNHLHCEYTLRAAKKGVHVLCEKPLAVTSEECEKMIKACEENDVLLMTAYRLHFEEANLKAMNIMQRGDLGDIRFFQSTFSQNVSEGDIRLFPLEKGGGTLYDMGIYCINAARYIFQDDPIEVLALAESREGDERFSDCDEMTSAILRFPNDRLATFTSSFGASDVAYFRVVGSEGELQLDRAYKYAEEMTLVVNTGEEKTRETIEKRDQFGPQLVYFSECIKQGIQPEPDGYEGLGDVQIVEALYESAKTRKPVAVNITASKKRPDVDQIITRPPVEKPDEVKASSPSE